MIPVIDGHNDLAWARRAGHGYDTAVDRPAPELHTDLPRLRRGGVGGQFWSVWVSPDLVGAEQVTATLEQIDFVQRMVQDHPHDFTLARTADGVREAMASGRIASLLGVEGGAQIDGSGAVLRQYARLGVRYMTLTWSVTTDWADSATDTARHGGLTDRGRDIVREMNRIGMLVDLAHVAPETMRDALETTTRPVIISHSGARAVCDHPRNVPDDVLTAVGAAGGVVMVPFVPSFLSQARRDWVAAGSIGPAPEVGIADAVAHIEHIRDVAGIAAVGIGADYDGTDAMPTGLEDVSCYPALLAALAARGWTTTQLEQLAHGNVLRVLEASDDDHRAFLAGRAPGPAVAVLRPTVDVSAREAAHPRVLIVVNSPTSGPRRLLPWLREEGVDVDTRLGSDGLPGDLADYDGLVMLGGGFMPHDDDRAPWLAAERTLAAEAIDADLPTLGICLGAQLLAHVGGGEVRGSFGPKERGSTRITTSAEGRADAVTAGLSDAAPMIENHQDMITRLPGGAVLLASSAAVAHQAFRLGAHVRGVQFHPEVAAHDLQRWDEPVTVTAQDRPVAELVAAAQAVDAENTAAARAMVAGFAGEVRAAAGRRAAAAAVPAGSVLHDVPHPVR